MIRLSSKEAEELNCRSLLDEKQNIKTKQKLISFCPWLKHILSTNFYNIGVDMFVGTNNIHKLPDFCLGGKESA